MNVWNLSIIISVAVLLPYISTNNGCPANDIKGCWCDDTYIICDKAYIGDDIPTFRQSHTLFEAVSYIYIYIYIYICIIICII